MVLLAGDVDDDAINFSHEDKWLGHVQGLGWLITFVTSTIKSLVGKLARTLRLLNGYPAR